ncbi:pyrimidine dimer DNA glycosylase/endonuclease V [Georgenia wangjunii]|uniref:pyrimidine dimer DNA glycosylase/endonuclease V n=1 Tax=Georgenia wangjunii TaxID=3117730 RepID=UPI002F26AE72
MRIWSLHPRYLDRQGLTACWREALLAQAVLAGRTRGYRNHPQLTRFKECPEPLAAIGGYLLGVEEEARARGYRYDATKIEHPGAAAMERLTVSDGQVAHEWGHLMAKLAIRSPARAADLRGVETPDTHPLFVVVPGPVAQWEIV